MSALSITVKTTDGSFEALSEWQLIICPTYPQNVQILSCCPESEQDLYGWMTTHTHTDKERAVVLCDNDFFFFYFPFDSKQIS